jgi:MFS transporter, YNFM family, putative membrane transport protein
MMQSYCLLSGVMSELDSSLQPTTKRQAIVAGTPDFKRSNRALFFGGFSTFALLYCVQPLLPVLSREFALTPAQSSWTLSASTGALAVSLLLTSVISDRLGRKPLMLAAMLIAAVMTVLCACAQNFSQLVALRACLGFALGGMPAVAMAYLGEEIDPLSLGRSMGLYIAGSAFGGMLGRLVVSTLSDLLSWRAALAIIGVLGIISALEFARSLPRSRNFVPSHTSWKALPAGVRQHFSDAGLPWLFLLAFLLLGCFVSMYNYIGYRLMSAPFGLRQSTAGMISVLYLIGIFSSVWAGRLVDRLGRRGVLWMVILLLPAGLLLTLLNSLVLITLGIAVTTFGFFASHSIASSWVGRRARAPQALASALYLFFYYLGSSMVGSLSGLMMSHGGWSSVVGILIVFLAAALLIGLRLRHLLPLGPREPVTVAA